MNAYYSMKRRGSALVVTLSIVVLMTVVLLAAFINVQMSGQLSHSHLNAFAASEYAQDGVEQAVGLLRYGTTDTNYYWVSQPGRLTRYSLSSTNVETVDLHSGLADDITNGVNGNVPLIQNAAEGSISFPATNTMPLKWIYVREDGTRDASSNYQSNNRVVGRYAFWVDDESTKINLNTAWTRTTANTNTTADPSHIPIVGIHPDLDEAAATTINAYRSTNFFNSQLDVLKAFGANSADYTNVIRQSKFWTTYFNGVPAGKTFFGRPKIVLTTNPSLALDDTGAQLPYINTNDWNATITNMVSYLSVTNWPMAPGHSFQEKYYQGNTNYLAQLAMNIAAYVVAKETLPNTHGVDDQNMMPLIHGQWSGNTFASSYYDVGFRTVTRGLQIVRIGMWRNQSTDGSPVAVTGRIYVTVYLPLNFGLTQVDLTRIYRRPTEMTSATSTLNPYFGVNPILMTTLSSLAPATTSGGGGTVSQNVIHPGEYATLSMPISFGYGGSTEKGGTPAFRKIELLIPVDTLWSQTHPGGDYYAMAAAPDANTSFPIPITESIPPTGTTLPASSQIINTLEIDDPTLGGNGGGAFPTANPGLWKQGSCAISAFNTPVVARTVGTSPTQPVLEQDVDSSGKITDSGVVLPAPPGTVIAGSPSSNPHGRIDSLAELGFIHTGLQPLAVTTYSLNVPWRTLRLQARSPSASTATVPDWALLDLFALPHVNTNFFARPNGFTRGGVINVNAGIQPFTNVTRLEAAQGLFMNATNFPASISNNVIQHNLAAKSYAQGRVYRGDTNAFLFPGELVEVSGAADTGETSEWNLPQVLDLAATQNNVFSVFSIGQSVVQTPDGRLNVRGEQRVMSIIQRVDQSGTIKFKSIFFKSL